MAETSTIQPLYASTIAVRKYTMHMPSTVKLLNDYERKRITVSTNNLCIAKNCLASVFPKICPATVFLRIV